MMQVQSDIQQQIKTLTSQIDQLNRDISKVYEPIDSENEAYKLHAICVHDGGAESGHYFVFIKDHYKNIWRKFNDWKIEVVTE